MSTTYAQFPPLEELKKRLNQRSEELRHELDKIQEQLDAVNTTLGLLDQAKTPNTPNEVVMVPPVSTREIIPGELRGLTQMEALIKIAKANNNRVRLLTAKDLFLKAGVTTSEKNAMNIVFNVIKRSGKFQKVSPGIYELLPDAPLKPDPLDMRLPLEH